MITARDTVYAALFDLLATTPGFASYWRRYINIKDLDAAQRPALMMQQVSEEATNLLGAPSKYKLTVDIAIICDTPATPLDAIPSATLNPLIDAVETILAPATAFNKQTLGLANVQHVKVEGLIEIQEAIGISDDLSLAVIPIVIICV